MIPPVKGAEAPAFDIIKQGDELSASEGVATLSITFSTDAFHQAFGEIMQSYIAGSITKDEACAQIEAKWAELG